MKPPRSLKARALQLLAQREQSQVELRRKLLAHAKAEDANAEDAKSGPAIDRPDPLRRVETVLEWLESHRFSSDERFAESRVNARAARYGNLRIRQELKQHAVTLTPEAAKSLEDSEMARALGVHERRFAGAPHTLAERAKQARFLASRGFSSEVIQLILRGHRGDVTSREHGSNVSRHPTLNGDDPVFGTDSVNFGIRKSKGKIR